MAKFVEMMPSYIFNLLINNKNVPVMKVIDFGKPIIEITKALEQDGISLSTYIDDGFALNLVLTCHSRDMRRKQYYYQDNLRPVRVYIPQVNAMESGLLLETLVLEEING